MPEYIFIPVRIPLKVGGDIHQRLTKLAERDGSTLKNDLEFVVMYGLYEHIRENLDRLEA